jgi:hypothetical protein
MYHSRISTWSYTYAILFYSLTARPWNLSTSDDKGHESSCLVLLETTTQIASSDFARGPLARCLLTLHYSSYISPHYPCSLANVLPSSICLRYIASSFLDLTSGVRALSRSRWDKPSCTIRLEHRLALASDASSSYSRQRNPKILLVILILSGL